MKKNLSLRLLLADKDKEIKDLKRQLEEEKNAYNRMYNMYVEKDNIIDELEKYLNDRSEFTNFGVIIDKLQELKGEDKE